MENLGPLGENDCLLDASSFYDDWTDVVFKNAEFERKLKERIYFIICKIHSVFNCAINSSIDVNYIDITSDACYDCGRDRNGLNLFDLFSQVIIDSNIKFIDTTEYKCKQFSILFDGKPVGIGEKFPKKWLFEDFEKELIQCKNDYINYKKTKEAERLATKSFNKLTKKQLQDALKTKLTAEELALISFKK